MVKRIVYTILVRVRVWGPDFDLRRCRIVWDNILRRVCPIPKRHSKVLGCGSPIPLPWLFLSKLFGSFLHMLVQLLLLRVSLRPLLVASPARAGNDKTG
jgi:hypothetical protein